MTTDSATATATAVINMLPIGTVMSHMGKPEAVSGLEAQGWLVCNGFSLLTKDYPALYSVIGNNFGGDANKFNLPNLCGMFLRGVDGSAGNDPDSAKRVAQYPGGNVGNKIGSVQPDDFKAHAHGYDHWVSDEFGLRSDGDSWKPPHTFTGATSGNTGGLETRPKNVYTYFIIFVGLPGQR